MIPVDKQSPPAVAPRSVSWFGSILTGVLVAVLLVGAAIWAFTGFGLFKLNGTLRGGELHLNVDQPTVVRQIRSLQRLETVSYTLDKIISGERENPVLPKFLAGDRLLLVV